MAANTAPLHTVVIPILWAVIGGSAAFALGVRTDLLLLAAGAVLLIWIVRTKVERR